MERLANNFFEFQVLYEDCKKGIEYITTATAAAAVKNQGKTDIKDILNMCNHCVKIKINHIFIGQQRFYDSLMVQGSKSFSELMKTPAGGPPYIMGDVFEKIKMNFIETGLRKHNLAAAAAANDDFVHIVASFPQLKDVYFSDDVMIDAAATLCAIADLATQTSPPVSAPVFKGLLLVFWCVLDEWYLQHLVEVDRREAVLKEATETRMSKLSVSQYGRIEAAGNNERIPVRKALELERSFCLMDAETERLAVRQAQAKHQLEMSTAFHFFGTLLVNPLAYIHAYSLFTLGCINLINVGPKLHSNNNNNNKSDNEEENKKEKTTESKENAESK